VRLHYIILLISCCMNPKYTKCKQIQQSKTKNNDRNNKQSLKIIKSSIQCYDPQEIAICNKIKQIPKFFSFFSPIISHSSLNAFDKYILVYKEYLVPFNDFFERLPDDQVFFFIYSSYFHLEKAFQLLNKHNILYGKYGKIGFNYKNQPMLFDFERKMDDFDNNMTMCHFPLERYCIAFLEKNMATSLSMTNIDEICKDFCKMREGINQNQNQNQNQNHAMYKKCVDFLIPWINKPKQIVIQEMNKYQLNWDMYSTSLLYLNLLSNIVSLGEKERKDLSDFVKKLQKRMEIQVM